MITDVQIVKQKNEFKRLAALDEPMSEGIPHAVVERVIAGETPVKVWRKYLDMTQNEAAEKLGITQGAYAQLEKAAHHQESTLKRIAHAFGIVFDQIDMV